MDKLLELLQLEDLDGDQRELADSIGIYAYRSLISRFGGTYVYIPKADTLTISLRNQRIQDEFDGYNINDLALKYGLSVNRVRDIVSKKRDEIKHTPLPGQLML